MSNEPYGDIILWRTRTYFDWHRWFVGVMVRLDASYGNGRSVCVYIGPVAFEIRAR